jgi:hypothetical protein
MREESWELRVWTRKLVEIMVSVVGVFSFVSGAGM